MAKKKNTSPLNRLGPADDLRKRVVRTAAEAADRAGRVTGRRRQQPKGVRAVIENLRSVTGEATDRITGGPAKRSARGRKAAATRKRQAARRSAAARKSARARAKAR